MIYKYHCKHCDTFKTIFKGIAEFDTKEVCNRCQGEMSRIISSPTSSKTIGAMESAKRDGVGCISDEKGNIHLPKTRGSATDRKNLRQRNNKYKLI